MHDERGLLDGRNLLLHPFDQPAQFQHQAPRQGRDTSARTIAAANGLLDQGAEALVLDAPRLPLGEGKVIGEPLHFYELEEGGVPRHAPTVEPERGSVKGQR